MWFDNLAIPADAKHVDEAHAFINYLMKPEVIAKSSNYVQTANGNLASQKFLDEAVLKNPSVYPTEERLKSCSRFIPTSTRSSAYSPASGRGSRRATERDMGRKPPHISIGASG